ncbi:MAG: hypothetical protein NTV77_03660, partial [Candidatus Azambacteria bacterium]|nr:hypothetical protein [Candidatus Azambacteria bacterium]
MVDIFIEEVSTDRRRVSIRALNVRFIFVREHGVTRIISKSKPEAQVYDPTACWVPKNVFLAVCRKAGAI